MMYNVTTYLGDKEIKSNEIKIQSKVIYGVLNKYIRETEYELKGKEVLNKNVVNF